MIRQQAFTANNKMLKGGLHCHTTRSDGRGTPEEVIRLHYENGYDFLALTDHRVYNYINYAPDLPITIIPGMEFDNTFLRDGGFRTFHTVCLGPTKDDGNPYEQDVKLPSGTAKDQTEYQTYLDELHANKNITILCHPLWSSTSPRWFENLKGNFAMEIRNTTCAVEYDMDIDAAYWDEVLGQNKRIFGVAVDDGHAMSNHCGSWVMVNAENNVNAILKALTEGAFYSTCGPEIYDFYVDDEGKAVVECSAAAKVRFHADMHPTRIIRSEDNTLTHAELDLKGNYKYIRAVVIDGDGRRAWTNPIFIG